MASTTESKAPVTGKSSKVGADGMPDFATWTKRQIGFAPYFNPEEGKRWFGKVVARDERDLEFVRYLVISKQAELECQRGPVDDAEKVTVAKGETFSISVYKGLENEFNLYLESGIQPDCLCTTVKKGKVSSDPKKSFWHFDVRVSPEDDVKLLAWSKAAQMKRLAATEREQLEA